MIDVPPLSEALSAGPLFGLPLPDIWFGFVFVLLATFLFLDGFDFGIGALFATATSEEERELLFAAVGPFWDGNEVWLVVFGGALFAAFPGVYADLFSRYYFLMFALLFALALRGMAPEFYAQVDDTHWKRAWRAAFVVGSVGAPFCLGVFAGDWLVGAPGILSIPGLAIGLVIVSLTVVDGVAFLGLKLEEPLRSEMVRYRPLALGAYLVSVAVTLGWIAGFVPTLRSTLLSPVGIGLVVLSLVLAGLFAALSHYERDLAAFVAVGGLDLALVALVAYLLYPTIDPAVGTTVRDAVVPITSLNLMTIMAAVLLPFVLGYFVFLYSVFSGPIEPESAY